jgi:hypothetical protein
MNRTPERPLGALLAAFLLLLANFNLHPASADQATQPAPTADQTDSNAAKSKKNKPGSASDSTSPAPAPPPAPASLTPAAKPPAAATKPATSQSLQPVAPTSNATMVWVNTESGIYHKQGSRYYGKTKQGKYMTEADAIKAGYRAAEKH